MSPTSQSGAQIVPRARSTDALGHALRQAFRPQALPGDLALLVHRLDGRPDRGH